MMFLEKLFFEAGGYTASNLLNASSTERRQILQLGNAVIFSTVASMISWGHASNILINLGSGQVLKTSSIIVTALVVLLVSLSINRNLIFYSDMREERNPVNSSYDPAGKKTVHALVYLRVALVLIVSILNIQLLKDSPEILIVIMLGLFELYPLLLKRQMGQTILGRRVKERLIYQQKRSELLRERYERKIQESEHEMFTEKSD